jgi:hypothetical protein
MQYTNIMRVDGLGFVLLWIVFIATGSCLKQKLSHGE